MAKLSVAVNENDHIQGPDDAPVTLVEYGDYECPSCGDAYDVVKRVQKHFGPKLRFVFRNFPLEQHEFAMPAAETAEFAAREGNFWEMHDALYENQVSMDEDLFPKLGKKLGLHAECLMNALEEEEFAAHIEDDMKSGEASGVRGTPTFYINGHRQDGSLDYETLTEAINAELKK
jgi:protein-disulfide isomerase